MVALEVWTFTYCKQPLPEESVPVSYRQSPVTRTLPSSWSSLWLMIIYGCHHFLVAAFFNGFLLVVAAIDGQCRRWRWMLFCYPADFNCWSLSFSVIGDSTTFQWCSISLENDVRIKQIQKIKLAIVEGDRNICLQNIVVPPI